MTHSDENFREANKCDYSTSGWSDALIFDHQHRHETKSVSCHLQTTPCHNSDTCFFLCGSSCSRPGELQTERYAASVAPTDRSHYVHLHTVPLSLSWKEMWWAGAYHCLHTLSTSSPQINRQHCPLLLFAWLTFDPRFLLSLTFSAEMFSTSIDFQTVTWSTRGNI